VGNHPALSARLLGAVEALHATFGRPFSPSEHAGFMADVAVTRRSLDADTFTAQWAVGQTLTLEGAIAEVLACYPRGGAG